MKKNKIKQLSNQEKSLINIEMSEKLNNTTIPKKEDYLYQTQSSKLKFFPRFVSICACLIFFVVCLSLIFTPKINSKSAVGMTSYIMEINPSICITTNKNDKIINVCALNDDANLIVMDDELIGIEGQSFDSGVEIIMSVIKKNGYFENYNEPINIYAFNDSSENQYNKLKNFEEIMQKKVSEFGYDIPLKKHRIGMDDFKEKIGFSDDYETLDDMQEFFKNKERSYHFPPQP